MKIEELIQEYKSLLIRIKSGRLSAANLFICHYTSNEVNSLFSPYGYYQNYMNSSVLSLKKVFNLKKDLLYSTKEFGEYKVKFLKNEIKELKALLKQGYTDL